MGREAGADAVVAGQALQPEAEAKAKSLRPGHSLGVVAVAEEAAAAEADSVAADLVAEAAEAESPCRPAPIASS